MTMNNAKPAMNLQDSFLTVSKSGGWYAGLIILPLL